MAGPFLAAAMRGGIEYPGSIRTLHIFNGEPVSFITLTDPPGDFAIEARSEAIDISFDSYLPGCMCRPVDFPGFRILLFYPGDSSRSRHPLNVVAILGVERHIRVHLVVSLAASAVADPLKKIIISDQWRSYWFFGSIGPEGVTDVRGRGWLQHQRYPGV